MSSESPNPMHDNGDDLLRKRMMEVALLPKEHPLRAAVDRDLVSQGKKAAPLWHEIAQEDQQLQEALAGVDVPATLQSRVLSLPDVQRHSPHRTERARWLSPWVLASAAAAMLLVVIGLWAALANRASPQAAQSLVPVVLALDQLPRQAEVTTPNWIEVQKALASKVPFTLATPAMNRPLTLVSGGTNLADGKFPVVHTVWTDGFFIYDLFQFQAADMGIRGPIARTVLCPMFLEGHGMHNCRMVLWSESGHDFALLVDPGDKPTPPLPT